MPKTTSSFVTPWTPLGATAAAGGEAGAAAGWGVARGLAGAVSADGGRAGVRPCKRIAETPPAAAASPNAAISRRPFLPWGTPSVPGWLALRGPDGRSAACRAASAAGAEDTSVSLSSSGEGTTETTGSWRFVSSVWATWV